MLISKSNLELKTKARFEDSAGFEPVPNHKHESPLGKSHECTINRGSSHD
jgi:hypothetical protein